MEDKKETRGRPKTGQKIYKNVGFRLEEEIFNKYENIAQEYSGLSLHTYIKNHFLELFPDKRNELIIMPLKKEKLLFLEEMKIKDEFLEELKEKINREMDNFIFKEMFNFFLLEYTDEIVEENYKFEEEETDFRFSRPPEVQEIEILVNVFLENYSNYVSYVLSGEFDGVKPLFSENYFRKIEEYKENENVGFFLLIIEKIKKVLNDNPPKNEKIKKYFCSI